VRALACSVLTRGIFTIIGLDPETGYSAEEARELAALFAGMRRLLEG